MDWIKWIDENWIWVCPVLVALYGIARAIVAATPTPADDEALKHVSKCLRVLAGIFGLNLKQGRKLPALVIIAGITLSPGCKTIEAISKDPAKQYKLAKIAYTETVITLIELKRAGKLSQSEVDSADRVIKLGRTVLRNWEIALIQGNDYPDGMTLIAPVMVELRAFIAAGGLK